MKTKSPNLSSPGVAQSTELSGVGNPCWIWPFRHNRRIADSVWRAAGCAGNLCTRQRWCLVALLVGLLPLAASYGLEKPGHQLIASVLLFPPFLALVREDRQLSAFGLVGGVFISHSILAIILAAQDPTASALIMPGGADYLDHQLRWIRTGYDPEYEAVNWIPAHFQLFAAIIFFGFTSMGLIPFYQGMHEVDLMNYYVGGMIPRSYSLWTTMSAGWHTWSILRGLAYTVLIYEVTSWSLERLCGRPLSTPQRRRRRWAIALLFFLADGVVKYVAMEIVRRRLYFNLAR